jgi:hypothetical protein
MPVAEGAVRPPTPSHGSFAKSYEPKTLGTWRDALSRLQKAVMVRVGLAVLFVLTGCMASIQIDLTGVWAGSITWTSGPGAGIGRPVTLDIVLDGGDLTGTVTMMAHGSQTFDLTIFHGRARDGSLELEASGTNPYVSPPVSVVLTLDGEYSVSQMFGTGTETVNGTAHNLSWEASRVSPPPDTASL